MANQILDFGTCCSSKLQYKSRAMFVGEVTLEAIVKILDVSSVHSRSNVMGAKIGECSNLEQVIFEHPMLHRCHSNKFLFDGRPFSYLWLLSTYTFEACSLCNSDVQDMYTIL